MVPILAIAEVEVDQHEPLLPVFLDCDSCDFDFLRREIIFVDWVRDIADAEIHVQIITQRTGSGGREFNVDLNGRGRLQGISKSLKLAIPPHATQDESREKLNNLLKIGLVSYISSPRLLNQFKLIYLAENKEANSVEFRDPWNSWVFEIDGDGYMAQEASQTSLGIDGMVSARRITKDWRLQIYFRSEYEQDEFKQDKDVITSSTREHRARSRIVKSLGSHWSAGFRGRAFSNTYDNMDLSWQFGPGIEYSLFDYEEEARRAITFAYSLNPTYNNYTATTIYGNLKETLINHSIEIDLRLNRPWGTARAGLEGIHYLNNFDHYRIESYGRLSLRLFKGVSIYLAGSFNRLNDQFDLVRGDASLEQILLRRRNLATDYEFDVDVGLNFTFGSIYNNVVNTRL